MESRLNAQYTQRQASAGKDAAVLPVYTLSLDSDNTPQRVSAEAFIHRRFKQHYGASITEFMPHLVSAANNDGIAASLGFQLASEKQPLFLEQYLDFDIETALSILTGDVISREGVVEIGNLASARQRATQTLFLLLAEILYQSGYDWVVFTANRSVKNWLEKLAIRTISIKEADPEKLTDKTVNWGSYYDDKPVVLAANIEQGFSSLNQNPLMASLRQSYQQQIDAAVEVLKR